MQVQTIQTTKFVKCPECQADILILPDIKAMSQAFNEHAKQHINHKYTTRSIKYKRANLINNLTQQLLLQITNTGNLAKPELYLLIETYYGAKRTRGIALNEQDAGQWVNAQLSNDPDGSYFYEKGSIYTGEE